MFGNFIEKQKFYFLNKPFDLLLPSSMWKGDFDSKGLHIMVEKENLVSIA